MWSISATGYKYHRVPIRCRRSSESTLQVAAPPSPLARLNNCGTSSALCRTIVGRSHISDRPNKNPSSTPKTGVSDDADDLLRLLSGLIDSLYFPAGSTSVRSLSNTTQLTLIVRLYGALGCVAVRSSACHCRTPETPTWLRRTMWHRAPRRFRLHVPEFATCRRKRCPRTGDHYPPSHVPWLRCPL